MHEMGIAMEIIEIASQSIPAGLKGAKVHSIRLKVGKLTAVVPESLRFCFEIASRESPLAGAALLIDEIPVRARCGDCGKEWTLDAPSFSCRACHSGSLTLLSGRELDIDAIEIEDVADVETQKGNP